MEKLRRPSVESIKKPIEGPGVVADKIFLDNIIKNEDDLGVKTDEEELRGYLEVPKEPEYLSRVNVVLRKFRKELMAKGVTFDSSEDQKWPVSRPSFEKYWILRFIENPSDFKLTRKVKESVDQVLSGGTITSVVSIIYFVSQIFNRQKAHEKKVEKRKMVESGIASGKITTMSLLKRRLADIDEIEDYPEYEKAGRISVFEDEKGLYYLEGDVRVGVTEGDLVADYSWGIKYRPDLSIDHKKWRRLRKALDINEAKVDLRYLINREININGYSGGSGSVTLEHLILNLKYSKIKEKLKKPLGGLIAERATLGFLERIGRSSSFKFYAEQANPLEDSLYKYDLKIIYYKEKDELAQRGVGEIQEDDSLKRVAFGIQLTTSKGGGHRYHAIKEGLSAMRESDENSIVRIKRSVDDIKLVRLFDIPWYDLFEKWVAEGRKPGGPEQYLTLEQKASILTTIFRNKANLTIDKAREICRG